MDLRTIKKLQRINGFKEIQDLINDGSVWGMEGSMGRFAMDTLRVGATLLPKTSYIDYYGGQIPSRYMVQEGTAGSKTNCIRYWSNFDEESSLW
jgi:hypothetical protein